MARRIARAISIRQPYVELILRGIKRAEYRSMPTVIRERVYLYAGLTPADDARAWKRAGCEEGSLPTGKVIGSVEVVGCRYLPGWKCYAYKLANPVRFKRPRKVRNQPQPVWWSPVF